MRKALLRIHQGQRGPAGVRLLVPQLHHDQLPTGRHRGNRTNRFSKSSFIVSLFSKDFCLFARIYNIKTNVSEMLICCCEREAAFLNWISALVTSLWHFKCCIVHNKGLKGWSLGWCWWCLHQVNYLLYLYLGRSLAWGLSSYYLSLQVQTLLPYGLPLPTPLCQGSNQIHRGRRQKLLLGLSPK